MRHLCLLPLLCPQHNSIQIRRDILSFLELPTVIIPAKPRLWKIKTAPLSGEAGNLYITMILTYTYHLPPYIHLSFASNHASTHWRCHFLLQAWQVCCYTLYQLLIHQTLIHTVELWKHGAWKLPDSSIIKGKSYNSSAIWGTHSPSSSLLLLQCVLS